MMRFRRNREILAREWATLLLWGAVLAMLVNFTRVLWLVAAKHLAEYPQLIRLSLPGLAVAAGVFCLFRARGNWREIREVRDEQAAIRDRLHADLEGSA